MITFIKQKIINNNKCLKTLIALQRINRILKINIKKRTYYFYNDIIDLENFESNLLKIDKESQKNIGIYNIGYITIKKTGDCKNINSFNPLYLRITHASGYIERSPSEEINGNKYLVFDSTDENKGLLKKHNDVFNGIKDEVKTINGGKENDYEKDYMKIKFNSDDDLPLDKPLKFHAMT